MATQGVFRNVNIITELNADNTTEAIDIYTPGIINPYDVVSGAKYSGFITSLRLTVDITSTPELILPSRDPLDSDDDDDAKTRELIYNTPRKSIALYLRNSVSKSVLVGEIVLFNRRPHYFVELLKYFSNATTFDVAPDTVVTVQMKNIGHGLLQGNDRIAILGSSVEEAPYIEPTTLVVE